MISHDYSSESTEENPRMMAFFDSLVQREIEGWDTSDGTEDTESEEISDTVVEEEGGTVSYTRRERVMQRMELSLADDLLSEAAESGIQSPSPDSSNITATSSNSNNSSVIANSSFNSNTNTSSSTISSVTLGDSGLDTSQGTSDGPSTELVLVNNSSEDQRAEIRHSSAETQTPPQSSQNLIADLIAKKRAHLVRRAKRRASKSEGDSKIENKIIQSARRIIRSDSGSSSRSGSSSAGTETDVTPISSPVLDWASASSPLSEPGPGPSTSSPGVTDSPLLQNLKRKRMKLLANRSETESEEELEMPTRSSVQPQGLAVPDGTSLVLNTSTTSSASSNPGTSSCSLSSQSYHTSQTQFRKTSKKEDRNVRKRFSEHSDSED